MKLVIDFDITIDVPNTGDDGSRLSKDSPIHTLLNNKFYLREVGLHTGSLKSIISLITKEDNIESVLDGMCGVGFAVNIIKKYIPNSLIYANDWDKNCSESVRKYEFLTDVYNKDANQLFINQLKEWDLIFLDFNTYTILNKPFTDMLIRAWHKTNKWLLFTDTANFGFRFKKNLVRYQIFRPEEYYYKLKQLIVGSEGYLRVVSSHTNAAIVAIGRFPGDPLFIQGERLTINVIKPNQGLGLTA